MLTVIMAFFTALPSIMHGFEAFTGAYFDAKVKLTTARIGGNVQVATQLVTGIIAEGQTRIEFLKVVSQSKFLMWIIGLWSAPWIFYEAKVVAWDNIIHKFLFGVYGYTPPITGLVGTHAAIILTGIFGTGGVMAVGAWYANRKQE